MTEPLLDEPLFETEGKTYIDPETTQTIIRNFAKLKLMSDIEDSANRSLLESEDTSE